ncbi:GNAT family N-acetyltransferase [Pseudomonas syringae]|uniref:GNAT family N-acetyltransferase n=1 Tax=Pseudomonas syringae TaxID=317 RepID=UPI003F76FE12
MVLRECRAVVVMVDKRQGHFASVLLRRIMGLKPDSASNASSRPVAWRVGWLHWCPLMSRYTGESMEPILKLDSARLLMRQWRDDDLPAFAAMCMDPQVMRYFPEPLSRLESAAMIGRPAWAFRRAGFWLLGAGAQGHGGIHRFHRAACGGFQGSLYPGCRDRLAPGA